MVSGDDPLESLTPESEERVRQWISSQQLRCTCLTCAETRALLGEVDRLRAALAEARSRANYGCRQCWDVVGVVDAAMKRRGEGGGADS